MTYKDKASCAPLPLCEICVRGISNRSVDSKSVCLHGRLILIDLFPQKSHITSGSFAEWELLLKASYECLPTLYTTCGGEDHMCCLWSECTCVCMHVCTYVCMYICIQVNVHRGWVEGAHTQGSVVTRAPPSPGEPSSLSRCAAKAPVCVFVCVNELLRNTKKISVCVWYSVCECVRLCTRARTSCARVLQFSAALRWKGIDVLYFVLYFVLCVILRVAVHWKGIDVLYFVLQCDGKASMCGHVCVLRAGVFWRACLISGLFGEKKLFV